MRTLPLLVMAALLPAGCKEFRSINPIADPAEQLEDPGITGDWVSVPVEDFDRTIIRITAVPRTNGEYRATFIDSVGNATHARVRPTMIGGHLVLDVWPEAAAGDADNPLPLHTPYFVQRFDPDTLVIATLGSPQSLLSGGVWGSGLPHLWMPDSPFLGKPDSTAIVTASTADIRRFLEQVQALSDVFGDEVLTLRRLR
jgi:hypothetical protein